MIDPKKVTQFDRTTNELEEFILFCCVVAGKNAHTQSKALEVFLQSLPTLNSPFLGIKASIRNSSLLHLIQNSRLGQYNKLTKCFTELADKLDNKLHTCQINDLESIHGIGPKTARFFLLHSRTNQQVAVLDTHILHYLRDQGIDAPKSTPSKGKKYDFYEQEFIKLASISGYSIADFDLLLWKQYSGNNN